MMEIVTRIGVLTVVLCSIANTQTIYVPHGINAPPNNNGPYPKLSHQYEISIDHGPYNYEKEQVRQRSQPDEDNLDLIKHQLPKSTAYKRAEQFQQEEEKPQYSRPEERQPVLQNVVPEVYVPKKASEIEQSLTSVHDEGSTVDAAYGPTTNGAYGPPADVAYGSDPKVPSEGTYPSQSPGYVSKVVRDPKLPQYFTMYEKRIIADPTDKYGKGPWRYLTYGHGITYGSREPGKVFEKGYGYIRALGRDHCDLPDHLCPPRDEKPFEYEGRKEPFFGYRPH